MYHDTYCHYYKIGIYKTSNIQNKLDPVHLDFLNSDIIIGLQIKQSDVNNYQNNKIMDYSQLILTFLHYWCQIFILIINQWTRQIESCQIFDWSSEYPITSLD